MKEIIKEYNVKLPELSDGKEFWYDTKLGELMVRHKAK
jgi:hypothetical protein